MQSDFKDFIDTIVLKKIEGTKYDRAEILDIRLHQTRARLYDQEIIEYGEMVLLLFNKDDPTQSSETLFWYTLDPFNINLQAIPSHMNLVSPDISD